MYSLKEFMQVVEEIAPLSLSKLMIERGSYDNSGIIVENSKKVEKALFALDLSTAAVDKASQLGCDTILTHHPAIYAPVKNLSVNDSTAALLQAVKRGMNVISLHLNLDIAERGIDCCLAQGLGGKEIKILDYVTEKNGYGREFLIDPVDISDYVNTIKDVFGTQKVIYYGNGKVEKVASFCGAGASSALDAISCGVTDVDTVVTSDLAHHHIIELVEKGKKVIILPHYVSEQYGFNKFYELVLERTANKVQAFYFIDKRFM